MGRSLAAALLLVVSLATVDNSDEACIRHLVNRERSTHHIPTLADNQTIDRIARRHSDEMAAEHNTFHNDHLAQDYDREAGGYKAGGENVGQGPDCQTIFNGFLGSPGHRANMRDRDYTQLGVGVSYDTDRTLYLTTDFYTPPDRARPRLHVPPTPRRCVT